jgi:hypothetical protein
MSIVLVGSTSGSVTLQEPAVAGTTVLDLPATSGNVVVDSATQTLTNKTLTTPTLTSPTFAGTPTGVGVLTSGTAVASTSGTSIDFTSLPSWVKRITVMFQGVSTNGSSNIQIQIGAGSVTTSGYLGSFVNTSSTVTSTNFTSGFGISIGDSGAIRHGVITISSLGSNSWACGMVIARSDAAAGGNGGGSITLGGTLDRVRITTVNGTDTFDAGTINILYE